MKSRALLLITALSAIVACSSTSGDVSVVAAPELGPTSLGLDDAELAGLVSDPELTKEIDGLRARECR